VDLQYEKEGKTAIFTLNRPESLNALSPTLFRELHDAFEDFKRGTQTFGLGSSQALVKRHFVLVPT
jgi:enoyl-CoA hydratase/carnithine racemase